jgi:2-polyprenyl-3-methyl-5-hydroxy-6-metoxy-1,4-benzoquinol methylase
MQAVTHLYGVTSLFLHIMNADNKTWNIKSSYNARPQPQYYSDEELGTQDTSIVWQPEVYQFAARAARKLGATGIIDIGCGCAGKLIALHPEFDVTGVDFGSNMEYCRQHYPFGQWIEADFESTKELPLTPDKLGKSVVVCSDVIEHLMSPDALLKLIESLLQHAPLALLSTPERNLTWGILHNGLPPNPCHVREWSLRELTQLLKSRGFDVVKAGLTVSHSLSPEKMTIFMALAGKTLTPAAREALKPELPEAGSFLSYTAQALRRTYRTLSGRSPASKARA